MKEKKIEKLISKMEKDFNLIASHFSQTRRFLWPEIKAWQKYVKSGEKVLDIGCANGRLLGMFKDTAVEYFGIDLSEELIAIAKKECQKYSVSKVNFQVANMLDLPFEDNSFDSVFCVATLHHMPSDTRRWQAVSEMYRVLKPGGLLFLNNWYFWNRFTNKKYLIKKQLVLNWLKGLDKGGVLIPWKDSKGKTVVNRYYYAFKKPELGRLLQKNGFEILENKIVARPSSNHYENNKGFESLVSIAQKPKQ